MILRTFIGACAVAVALAGCSDNPGRPTCDGYTLHGLVLHADSSLPLSGVDVLVGSEADTAFRPYSVTGDDGRFTFKPTPNTAPTNEVFRFLKDGYAPLDVPARTATRLEEFRYGLEVRIHPETIP